MEKRRPKLGLFVSHTGIRLRLVRALSSNYRIEILSSKNGLIKGFRKTRPVAVLLCATPRELAKLGAQARALKTEQRPPWVGLIALSGLPPHPDRFVQAHLLDALTDLSAAPDALERWVDALVQGKGFVAGDPAPQTPWQKALGRLSGFRAS
jgi:hypothetical protein